MSSHECITNTHKPMKETQDFIKMTNEEDRQLHEEIMETWGYSEEIRLEFRRALQRFNSKWTDEKRLAWWEKNKEKTCH